MILIKIKIKKKNNTYIIVLRKKTIRNYKILGLYKSNILHLNKINFLNNLKRGIFPTLVINHLIKKMFPLDKEKLCKNNDANKAFKSALQYLNNYANDSFKSALQY